MLKVYLLFPRPGLLFCLGRILREVMLNGRSKDMSSLPDISSAYRELRSDKKRSFSDPGKNIRKYNDPR
jgi:hypothetical protein